MTIKSSDWSNSKPEQSFQSKLEPSNNLFAALSDTHTSSTPAPIYSSPAPAPSRDPPSLAVVSSNITSTQLPFPDQTNKAGVKVSCQVNRKLISAISAVFVACAIAFGIIEWPFGGFQVGDEQCALRQEIDTGMDLVNPKISVDGNLMVLVARDASVDQYSPTRIAFYSKQNDEWKMDQYYWLDYYYDYNVALSGDTALFAFDNATEAVIYEYNSSGSWVKRDDSIKPDLSQYRQEVHDAPRVDIEGDLACICIGSCHVYRRQAGVWMSIADFLEISQGKCSVVENSIAIYSGTDGLKMYKYESEINDVVPIQDYSIPAYYGFALSEFNFVYANGDGSISILERSNDSEPYSFVQKLNDLEHTGTFALDGNLLVIGEYDQTTIYGKQGGVWNERAELNGMHYGHRLSDGVLLAINDRLIVEAYNLDDCVPVSDLEMLPTSPPLNESRDCLGVDISIEYSACPELVSWDLTRNESGAWYQVSSYNEVDVHPSSSNGQLCLIGGLYNFTLFITNSSSCAGWPYYYGVDYYAISVTQGDVIIDGTNVKSDTFQIFSLP